MEQSEYGYSEERNRELAREFDRQRQAKVADVLRRPLHVCANCGEEFTTAEQLHEHLENVCQYEDALEYERRQAG